MKLTISLFIVILILTGCGRIDRKYAELTGLPSEICYGNVKYLQFTSGVTPKLNILGHIVTCN